MSVSNEDGARGPQYWRNRAEEARTIAETLHDATAKATMLNIATHYERLARRANDRETRASQ
jgi:hypothetical protein